MPASIGRALLILGLVLAVVGGVLLLAQRFSLPRLPGDLSFRRGNVTVHVPLGTSLLLSIVLTVILNLLLRRR